MALGVKATPLFTPPLQVYDVAPVPLMVTELPTHTAEVVVVELTVGNGLTTTVTFCVLLQVPALIAYEYITLIGLEVVLINISFGAALCGVVIAALLIPETAALVHVNVPLVRVLVGLYVNAVPLQIAGGVSVLVKVGKALNVIGSEAIPFAVTTKE